MRDGVYTLKRTEFTRKTPMSRTGILSAASFAKQKAPARKKTLKSKQRPVTEEDKKLWDRLAALGCVACLREGVFEPDVSIHHVDGRTKPDCHKKVLPLCASHHQDGTGKNPQYIAVHPWKTRFEARFGTQKELMAYCAALIEWRKP